MSTSRRAFLATGAAGLAALVIGCRVGPGGEAGPVQTIAGPEPAGSHELSAWVAVHADGMVEMTIPEAEMGQGSTHALALLLADEMQVPFDRVGVRLADADTRFGRQSTGGSSSIRRGHDATRKLGAAAREMLVAAAAARWGVDPGTCTVGEGAVHHPDHGTLGYGEVASEAAAMPVPESPTPRPHDPARLPTVPRWDLRPKVEGTAEFGLDVRIEDMVYAAVARPPALGATLDRVEDDAVARAMPGVVDVVVTDRFVAVLARDTWTAMQGRDALEVSWTPGHADLSTERVRAVCAEAMPGGAEARNDGDVDAALAGAAQTLEATFEAPYLAHAPMEPLSATARVAGGRCEVWVATQNPTRARAAAAEAAGVPEGAVSLHTTFLGGGFGRRSNADFVVDAVEVAKASGRPVQVVWSREEDIRGGRYRPFSLHTLRAGLDRDGRLVAWDHSLACPSILAGRGDVDGIDRTSIEGAANVPYAVPNLRVTAAAPDLPVSVWFWRSVGSSQNAWVTECFIDEVAALAGADPVAFRLGLLGDKPRHARALRLAADKAGWGTPVAEGRARGVAVHESFGSFCAQVVEASLDGDTPRVHRVTAVLDCGQVVTPDAVEAQVHSAIAYALSAALWGRIDLEAGQVMQGNFDDYRVLRFGEMPEVDVTLVAEGEDFGGVGEPGTPPVAPALCNALRALTGKPVRSLPIV